MYALQELMSLRRMGSVCGSPPSTDTVALGMGDANSTVPPPGLRTPLRAWVHIGCDANASNERIISIGNNANEMLACREFDLQWCCSHDFVIDIYLCRSSGRHIECSCWSAFGSSTGGALREVATGEESAREPSINQRECANIYLSYIFIKL